MRNPSRKENPLSVKSGNKLKKKKKKCKVESVDFPTSKNVEEQNPRGQWRYKCQVLH